MEELHSTWHSQASNGNAISHRVQASEISEVKSRNGAISYDSVASAFVYVPVSEMMPAQVQLGALTCMQQPEEDSRTT